MHAIAISLYDKFEELAVFVDIVRQNWDAEYYIVVACAHPDGEQHIDDHDIDVDSYVQGGRVTYSPDMDDGAGTVTRKGVNRTTRILDSMFLACLETVSADAPDDVETVMHCHADAWPLSESSFRALVAEMYDRDRRLAVRGHGLEWRDPNDPLGFVMDQFFVFDAEFATERRLFEADPLSLLPHLSIHASLAILLLGRAGLENVWFYSRMMDDRQWDGSPVDLPFTGVRPGIYNPNWDLLHVATDEFPDDLGKSVQAHHLVEHGPWSGEHVTSYIDSYHREDVFERMDEYERALDRKVRRLGFVPERYGRKYATMEAIVERYSDNPLRSAVRFLKRRVVREGLFRVLGAFPSDRLSHLSDPHRRRFHHDAEWPEPALVRGYQECLQRDDFPEDMSFWFDGCYDDS